MSKDPILDLEQMCCESKSTSLIMGFPDFHPAENLVEYIKDAVSGKDVLLNQYCARGNGRLSLLQALADLYTPLFNRTLDPVKNVATSIGATEALLKLFRTFTSPGDEVIIFDPFYCPFSSMVEQVGAVPVFVTLKLNRSPDGSPPTSDNFYFDPEEFEAAFTERTKMVLLNTPHNPTGKMFTTEEMDMIADACKRHNVICVADEVYEMFIYSDREHIKMATLPGMWERTITVGSIGKLFGMTAWATGFLIGAEHLIEKYLQLVVFPLNNALQEVYAQAYRHEINRLHEPDCYFTTLPKKMKRKLNKIMSLMSSIGVEPIEPHGGYFVFADVSNIDERYCLGSGDKASRFARWLCKEKGLAVAPANVFYSPKCQHLAANFVRICFIKSDATLAGAAAQLEGLNLLQGNKGEKIGKGVASGVGKDVTNGVANGAPNGVAKDATNGVANGVTNGVANGVTKCGVANGVINGVANDVTNGVTTNDP